MPRIRWQLTAHEEARYLFRSRQLAARGIDIQVPEQRLLPAVVDIEAGRGPEFYNVIFDHKHQVIISIGIRMIGRRNDIYIDQTIELTLPWSVREFELWDFGDGKGRRYRVAGLEVERECLLNDQLQRGIRLPRGKPITGLLIARALGAQIPSQYAHGVPVELGITLIDSLGRYSRAQGVVFVNRRIGVPLLTSRLRKSTLFEPHERYATLERSHIRRPPVSGNGDDQEFDGIVRKL